MTWNVEDSAVSRVLIVDDDEGQLQTLSEILGEDGFEVITCITAREAVDRFAQSNVDVGIVDLRLPDMGHVRLLDTLAEVAETVPLIIHTAHGTYQSAQKAVNVGAFAYIEKESDPAEVVRQVRRALRMRMKRYAEALESEVAARTGELQKANDALKREITERMELQEALAESESKYRRLVEGSPAIVYAFSSERGGLFYSSRVTSILGYSPAHLVEHPFLWNESIHPDDLPQVQAAIRQASPDVGFDLEYRVKSASGKWVWLHDCSLGTRHEGDEVLIEGMATDITERKRAQEQLRERENELVHLGRLSTMGEMAAGIAHEVKQPLYAITNYATAITRHLQNATADPRELAEAVGRISAQARRASDIINRLRNTVQKRESHWSATDINDLLNDLLMLVEHELRHESVPVDLDFEERLPLVSADAVQIQQVALNLIRNALDAMRGVSPTQRRLTLSTSAADGDAVEVGVGDTGMGLSDEVRRKVFDAFFTTKAEGLGMGLAISRRIVEAHEGRIWATPNSPHGTVFHFAIPTVPEKD